MSTESVLEHHLESLTKGDLESIMADYREESVVITPDGPLRGLKDIRRLFSKIVDVMMPPGSDIEIVRKEVEGDIAYTVWRGSSPTFNFLIGTDTFIVREGVIVYQTFAAQLQPKGLYKSHRPPPP